MMYIIFLLATILGSDRPLYAAARRPILEEKLQLASFESMRAIQKQLDDHTPLSRVLTSLVVDYVGYAWPTVIAYEGCGGQLGYAYTFRILSMDPAGRLSCKMVSYNEQSAVVWKKSSLLTCIAQQLGKGPQDMQNKLYVLPEEGQSNILEQVGIDRSALQVLRMFLLNHELVDKGYDRYKSAEKRSTFILDAGYTIPSLGMWLQEFYKKTDTMVQVPLAELSKNEREDVDSILRFRQAYKFCGGDRLARACQEVDENRGLLLSGDNE